MQLKCKECGHTFEDNDTYIQYNLLTAAESDDSYTGDPCCPYCGSVDIKFILSDFIEKHKSKIDKITPKNPTIAKDDEWREEGFWDGVYEPTFSKVKINDESKVNLGLVDCEPKLEVKGHKRISFKE